MEDRFKFRVWDTEKRQMITAEICALDILRREMHISQSGDLERFCGYDGEYITAESRYIAQTCTGLKDRNGALIYEGDIVCIHPLHEQNYQLTYKGVVEWSPYEGGYYVRIGEMDEYRITATWDGQILGNIYEHPHILQSSSISKSPTQPPETALPGDNTGKDGAE